MINTSAACCLISTQPGVTHSSSFSSRLSAPVKCAHCNVEYRLEFAHGESYRIPEFESRFRRTAQRMINADHSSGGISPAGHSPIISVNGV